jgi:diguanylate cyclase (GGDEF)-like protein
VAVDITGMSSVMARDERKRLGRVAAMATPVLALMMLITMPLLGFTEEELLTWAACISPAAVVVALVAWYAPWDRWPARALLAIPLTAWVGLSVLGTLSEGKATVYAGYSALMFLYVGLTQRPWTSIFLLPVAITTNVALFGGLSAELAARLPISITVWVATAEVVARYRMRTVATVSSLEVRAHVDPLTGCDNRYDLSRRLAALRPGDAVCLLDVDHFKRLNDTRGHAAGDEVLVALGAALRRTARRQDTLIRYGGEEFLVLLPGAGRSGAVSFDERLRRAWSATGTDVTFSAGLAVVGPLVTTLVPTEESGAVALANADAALYVAKARGRDRGEVWPVRGPSDGGRAEVPAPSPARSAAS